MSTDTVYNFDTAPVVQALREIADMLESRKVVVLSGALVLSRRPVHDSTKLQQIKVDSNLVLQQHLKGGRQ